MTEPCPECGGEAVFEDMSGNGRMVTFRCEDPDCTLRKFTRPREADTA